jgi:hypothetical protein
LRYALFQVVDDALERGAMDQLLVRDIMIEQCQDDAAGQLFLLEKFAEAFRCIP